MTSQDQGLPPMPTLTHHGAVTGVTGSCHELTLHGPSGAKAGILVDCGIFQGDEAAGRGGADALAIDFPIAHIRALDRHARPYRPRRPHPAPARGRRSTGRSCARRLPR